MLGRDEAPRVLTVDGSAAGARPPERALVGEERRARDAGPSPPIDPDPVDDAVQVRADAARIGDLRAVGRPAQSLREAWVDGSADAPGQAPEPAAVGAHDLVGMPRDEGEV